MKHYIFWKENKLDQEFRLTLDEIKIRYKTYLETKDQSWLQSPVRPSQVCYRLRRYTAQSQAEDQGPWNNRNSS